jgi:hypothetical protein
VTDPFAEFDSPRRAARASEDAAKEAATDDAAADDEVTTGPVAHRRPRRWPGLWSFWIAIGMVVVTAVAIGLGAAGEAVTTLTLTVSALGLCGIALVLGVIAIIGNWSRMWGIIGAGIALVLNPLVLVYLLGTLGAI